MNADSLAILAKMNDIPSIPDEYIRKYSRASKRKWSEVIIKGNVKEEFMIGYYNPDDGGTIGEFSIAFVDLNQTVDWRSPVQSSPTARLKIYDDGMNIWLNMPDLMVFLAQTTAFYPTYRKSILTPDLLEQGLRDLGFIESIDCEEERYMDMCGIPMA